MTHSRLLDGLPRLAARFALLLPCCALLARDAGAQGASRVDPRSPFVSREALVHQAEAAERWLTDASLSPDAREVHRGDAWVIRQRLEHGDFGAGDRIILHVVGEEALSDTFTVSTGPELVLANLPPVTLAGVLRSELQDHLTRELSRYIREPRLTAMPLIRVAVVGPIGRPGFYHVRADMLLSDLVMAAGGPAETADFRRARIQRDGTELYSGHDIDVAITDGISLDMLGLRSGDEFRIGERRRINWGTMMQIASVVSGVVALVIGFGS